MRSVSGWRSGVVSVVILGFLGTTGAWAQEAAPALETPPCGTRADPPATYPHVVWIWMENHDYGEIIGSGDAPFINKTLAAGCGLATNYHSITHPSLPNYIAATSGLPAGALGRFRSDCNATPACRSNADSIFAQAPSWSAYEESMPKPCFHWFHGAYAASHNPAVYYRRLAGCTAYDLPYYVLARDLAADTLPAFVFITPDMCHNMHNCAVATGDAWLARAVRTLVESAAYVRGDMAIFVTFDEGGSKGSNQCARNTHDAGCHVATLVVSPYTPPGTRAGALFNHYSLLRTTEELLGMPTYLGRAAAAASMRAAFHL